LSFPYDKGSRASNYYVRDPGVELSGRRRCLNFDCTKIINSKSRRKESSLRAIDLEMADKIPLSNPGLPWAGMKMLTDFKMFS